LIRANQSSGLCKEAAVDRAALRSGMMLMLLLMMVLLLLRI
jgi:hypothetical protein